MRYLATFALVIATGVCAPAVIVADADTRRGPLMQAALASLDAQPSKRLPLRSEKIRSDWAAVARVRPGGEVILPLRSLRPATANRVGTHVRRGRLIGAAIGAGLGAAIGASDEFDEPLPMMGVGALSPSSPDVIYHVD